MTPLPELGSTFAGYRLESYVARGGMGIVYSATHLRLSRTVALKLLAPELAEDTDFRTRFLKEAQLAASLEHPSVVPVYDAGEEEGLLYLAMRYLQGGDLRGLLQRQGRLSLERSLSITEQVAGALDAAHARGLVHRDVKPANILFDEAQERAYLGDFGVAKRQSSKGLTQTGSFLGSVDYCAPEQIESAVVDGRADVYALGGVFYHCLTGQPPYVRETEVAVLTAHLRDPPPALSRVRPDLPAALDGVIVTAMAKYPQVRYATAGEFAGALREAVTVAHQPETIRAKIAESPSERPTRMLESSGDHQPSGAADRRRPGVIIGVAGVAVALAAIGAVSALVLIERTEPSRAAPDTATSERQVTVTVESQTTVTAPATTVTEPATTTPVTSPPTFTDTADDRESSLQARTFWISYPGGWRVENVETDKRDLLRHDDYRSSEPESTHARRLLTRRLCVARRVRRAGHTSAVSTAGLSGDRPKCHHVRGTPGSTLGVPGS
jgi:serine/threonine-protein kinase